MASIGLGDAWDGAALGYDAWKTRSGYDERDEPNGYDSFYCEACRDVGWLLCEDTNIERPMVIACTECSKELELWDLDDE